MPLPSAAEFERIAATNTPVIFTNAWKIFGPRVARWRERRYLLEELGDVESAASLYDIDRTKDRGDRFSPRPVRRKHGAGYDLLMAYKERWNIRRVIENDWRQTRALAFMEQVEAFLIDELVMRPPAGQPCAPPVYEPRLWADVGPFAPLLRESAAEVMTFNLWLGKIPDAEDGHHPGRRGGSAAGGASGGGASAGPIPGRFVKEAVLHNDPNDNLLLQLAGNKTVWMYGMADEGRMYPQDMPIYDRVDPWDGQAKLAEARIDEDDHHVFRPNFSPLNPHAPDFKALPHAREARLKKCELRPGDALYMPALTWHDVISTPDAHELNVAANVWFWAKCGSVSPYKRVSMAACARYRDEIDRPGFRDSTELVMDMVREESEERGEQDEDVKGDDDKRCDD